jgi:hypothetical protein
MMMKISPGNGLEFRMGNGPRSPRSAPAPRLTAFTSLMWGVFRQAPEFAAARRANSESAPRARGKNVIEYPTSWGLHQRSRLINSW